MISKELLKVILVDKQVDKVDIRDNNVWFKKAECTMVHHWEDECINIYELAHKCKEWAKTKGYKLLSMNKEAFLYEVEELYDVSEQLTSWSEWLEADTECEAIFKICEWILENRNSK